MHQGYWTTEIGVRIGIEKGLKGEERRQLCREMRRLGTPVERLLWEMVRDRRFERLKFRRQRPMGAYVADFFCAEKNLVVELDGGMHSERSQRDRDQARDETLAERGALVFRISNEKLLLDPEGTLARLRAFLPPLHLRWRGAGGEARP